MTVGTKDIIELAVGLTPGEQFQNWLARKGIGEPVQVRTLYQPEPPPGIWVMLNGAVALGALAVTGYVVWLAATRGVPALIDLVV